MSAIVSLPGAAALSPFRLDKIRREAAQLGLTLGTLAARHWHFLRWTALDAPQMQLVEQALDYGTRPLRRRRRSADPGHAASRTFRRGRRRPPTS
jgi:phosphoribosylformylglycinamidine synthase